MSINNFANKSVVFAYHHVCNHIYPAITRVTVSQFKKQIEYLKNNNFSFRNLTCAFLNETKIVSNRVVSITFDDAINCLKDNALSVLMENNFTATIFVVTKYVGKTTHWDYYKTSAKCQHLSWNQLREISKSGFEIGSHSHTHFDLKMLKYPEIKNEMEYSKKLLEDKIGQKINFFSYPFGRFNRQIMRICQESGYGGAVSMNPSCKHINQFALPRSAVYLFDNLGQFRLKLKADPASLFEHNKLKVINFFSMGTIILNNFKRQ